MTIGERIKFCRECAQLTQEELGEKIGVTGVTIMRYEKGTRQPRIEQIVMIATKLGVSPLALMGDEVSADTVSLVLGGSFEATNNYKNIGYSFTEVERDLIKAFSQLNDNNQQKVKTYAQDLSKIDECRRTPEPPENPAENGG